MTEPAPQTIALLVGLLIVTIPIVALAKRVNVSYPIVLVLAGLVLGFVPGLPHIQLNPDLVLLLFLPPLLYWEAITAPTDVMLENAGQIGVLAVGLVIATTGAVAVAAHALIPGVSWPVAFVFGAIVSPTDELAAVPVLERFRLPRHIIAIAEGESLLNDATALVIYATALIVATTGVFQPGLTLLHFVLTVAGSIAIGFIAGRVATELWHRIRDRQLQSVISVTLPFLAYVPASHFGLSGVLAVVVAGVIANRETPRVLTPAARTQLVGFWNTLVFIANAVLFLAVGLQLHVIVRAAFQRESWQLVLISAVVVNVTITLVRLALVLIAEYAPTAAPPDHAAPNWRNAMVVAWSGLRGSVSLAAALALPLTLASGEAFPHRELMVFLTFTVILVTLVGGGLTLPIVVRVLHIQADDEEGDELRLALKRSSEAALTRIAELEAEGHIDAAHAEVLRRQVQHGIEHAARDTYAEREVLKARRRAVIDLRETGEIDNVVLRRVQADLDLAATRSAFNDGETMT